jgi:hypothetical protein
VTGVLGGGGCCWPCGSVTQALCGAGRYSEATAALAQNLEVLERVLGKHHVGVAAVCDEITAVCERQAAAAADRSAPETAMSTRVLDCDLCVSYRSRATSARARNPS